MGRPVAADSRRTQGFPAVLQLFVPCSRVLVLAAGEPVLQERCRR